MRKRTRKLSIKTKVLSSSILINIIICLILVTAICQRMRSSMITMGKEEAALTAQFTADKIDADALAGIEPGDEGNEDYNEILTTINDAIEGTSISYIYILYTDGDKVYYSMEAGSTEDETAIGEEFEESYADLKEAFDGTEFTEEEIDDSEYGTFITSYVPILNESNEVVGVLGCDYNASKIIDNINENIKLASMIGLICVVGAILISNLVISGVILGLKKVDGKIYDLVHSEGDLTQTIDIKSGDEMELIADNVNSLLSYIRGIMIHISESSNNLNNSSQKVVSSLNDAQDSVSGVSSTMEEMSASMEETTASLNQINTSIGEIYKFIEDIFNQSTDGSKFSQEIQTKAMTTRSKAINTQEQVKEQTDQMIQAVNETIEQSSAVKRITELATNIITITEQTNLLALNASIEAARAGESGKGFAVVADEIGKLAANSAEVAAQINGVSADVIKAVEKLADNSKEMLSFMNETTMQGFENLVEISENYSDDASSMNDRMQKFSEQSKQLQENMDAVRQAVEEVNIAVEESAKGVVSVTEMSVNLVGNVQDIGQEAESNQTVASELIEEVNKFKL